MDFDFRDFLPNGIRDFDIWDFDTRDFDIRDFIIQDFDIRVIDIWDIDFGILAANEFWDFLKLTPSHYVDLLFALGFSFLCFLKIFGFVGYVFLFLHSRYLLLGTLKNLGTNN